MALSTYIPASLEEEQNRFKTYLGNIQLDYRKATGSAPYLFSTPYVQSSQNFFEFSVAPGRVPTGNHMTGDRGNYRRFSTDVALASEDFQRNVIVLALNGILFSVRYINSTYSESIDEDDGTLERYLFHKYEVIDTNIEIDSAPELFNLEPLVLDITQEQVGLIDKIESLVFRKSDESFPDEISYEYGGIDEGDDGEGGDDWADDGDDLGDDFPDDEFSDDGFAITGLTITYEEVVTSSYGAIDSIVPESQISSKFKNITLFTASEYSDESFKTSILAVSSFNKTGEVFSSRSNGILSDSFSNYRNYARLNTNDDLDIVGYNLNLSPSTGVLVHVTMESDLRDHIDTMIGKSGLFYKTVYTGLLGSPFVMLKFLFSESNSPLSIKVNGTTSVLGTYSADNFTDLVSTLSARLDPLGISVIGYEGNYISLDRRDDSESSIELGFISNAINIHTLQEFNRFATITDATVTLTSNPISHPKNQSFTYIEPETDAEGQPNEFRFVLTKNGDRPPNHGSKSVLIDLRHIEGRTIELTVTNTEQPFKTEVVFEDGLSLAAATTQVYETIKHLFADSVRYTLTKDETLGQLTLLDKYSTNAVFGISFEILDEIAPILVAASVMEDGSLTLTYNEKLTTGSLDPLAFNVVVDDVSIEVNSVQVFDNAENTVVIGVTPSINSSQVVSIEYSGTIIKDTVGNIASSFNTTVDSIDVVNNSEILPPVDEETEDEVIDG